MLGKSLFSLLKYAIVGAVAITLGAELIQATSSAVHSLRDGNPLPLLFTLAVTMVLMYSSGRMELTKGHSRVMTLLLNVLAYSSLVYLFLIVFLGMLPWGIPLAVASAGVTAAVCHTLRQPGVITTLAESAVSAAQRHGLDVPFGTPADESEAIRRVIERRGLRVLILPPGSLRAVLRLLVERPMLPVTVTHFDSLDALVVATGGQDHILRGVESVLREIGLDPALAPSMLEEAILYLPQLEANHGLPLDGYCLATEENAVKMILEAPPSRVTAFPPSKGNGVAVVVRREDSLGMDVRRMSRGEAVMTVLGREYNAARMEVVVGVT
ncbi:MAG: hypothetical protein HXY34_05660 [Candidatus Thorarchaeota archaeon]|nr:hypothetical protein [Candidatus Thorarchaeota archaeon]